MKKILSLCIILDPIHRLQLFVLKTNIFNQYILVNLNHIRESFERYTGLSTTLLSPIKTQLQNNKNHEQLQDQSQHNFNEDPRRVFTKKTNGEETRSMQGLDAHPLKLVTPTNHVLPDVARLRRASWAFTTRRVPHDVACSTIRPKGSPCAGDLVLARVDAIGHHAGLQLPDGRRKVMFEGDEIVVAYGSRYASSQFEALLPETMGPCHLVAGGGVASRAISWHNRITKGPTHITPIGLLVDADGQHINLRDFAIQPKNQISTPRPVTVAVVGTSMDSGKTQTAAYFARGLIASGLQVGYAKITGTGAGGDTWLLKDAGASPVLDFTDAGMATTYMASPEEIECILMTLVDEIAQEGVDAIILEIADGVFQRETATLLQSPVFNQLVDGIVVAARDSMGASAGVNWLNNQNTQVLALSGVISSAPLQSEEARVALDLPVYNREDLSTSNTAMNLIDQAQLNIDNISNKTKNIVGAIH